MSTHHFRAVLDGLDEVSWCRGTTPPTERLALALPDGDVGAIDDPHFVPWLLAHAEPAPFGDGTKTRVDPKVRAAHRLAARDQVAVHGFEPAAILDEIEAALSPSTHLAAYLTDVIVYPKGGKFERHKDTPRTHDLVGTLVVGLPIAHTGGAFVLDDGRGEEALDWGTPKPGSLPWVALFSDVDHAIKPVKSGTRVTLVYALRQTASPRTDARAAARREALRAACSTLGAEPRWPLMIACSRRVIAEPDAKQPQGVETLRGLDREIADALVEAGYRASARACIAAVPDYEPRQPVAPGTFPAVQNLWAVTRLKAVPPADVIDAMTDEADAQAMEDYMLDSIGMPQWIVRNRAAAMLIQEHAVWSESGYFGNEGYDAMLYTVAAIEVDKRRGAKKPAATKAAKQATPKPKPKAKASKPRKKPASKPRKKPASKRRA